MFTIFDFEKEMDENKIHQDFEKVRSRFDSKSTSSSTAKAAPEPPSYWERVEKYNPGLVQDMLDSMW